MRQSQILLLLFLALAPGCMPKTTAADAGDTKKYMAEYTFEKTVFVLSDWEDLDALDVPCIVKNNHDYQIYEFYEPGPLKSDATTLLFKDSSTMRIISNRTTVSGNFRSKPPYLDFPKSDPVKFMKAIPPHGSYKINFRGHSTRTLSELLKPYDRDISELRGYIYHPNLENAFRGYIDTSGKQVDLNIYVGTLDLPDIVVLIGP